VRHRALPWALLLAACQASPPDPDRNAAAPAPVATASAPSPQASPAPIGQVSGLHGATSGLSGTISDFIVERSATETRVQLAADTLFAFDQATLTPEAQANLQRTAQLVREGGAGAVTVIGHTDAKGAAAYNLDLSRRRAAAVAAWLGAQPDMAHRFTPVGRGATEPVAPNTTADGKDDPVGRARNRRVVVVIPR
jgi:outer membrane protein OmpA-like peptidoglycan-associated protein